MKYTVTLICCSLILLNCGRSDEKKRTLQVRSEAEILYGKYCKGCHGKKGDRGFKGATDLQTSTLDFMDRVLIITDGKGEMLPNSPFLSEEEIILLADYIKTLRKF